MIEGSKTKDPLIPRSVRSEWISLMRLDGSEIPPESDSSVSSVSMKLLPSPAVMKAMILSAFSAEPVISESCFLTSSSPIFLSLSTVRRMSMLLSARDRVSRKRLKRPLCEMWNVYRLMPRAAKDACMTESISVSDMALSGCGRRRKYD